MSLDLFHYYHKDKQSPKTMVLLHGTGADEHDLVPLAEKLVPQFNILSLRGNIVEQGMNRFFKRLSFGVFDEENIREEAEKFQQFMKAFLAEHNQTLNNVTFLGFSNGANMILSLLFLHPKSVTKAVLLHPMLPFNPDAKLSLTGKKILVTYGENDRMITAEQSKEVVTVLKNRQAEVEIFPHDEGHNITRDEMLFVKEWLEEYS